MKVNNVPCYEGQSYLEVLGDADMAHGAILDKNEKTLGWYIIRYTDDEPAVVSFLCPNTFKERTERCMHVLLTTCCVGKPILSHHSPTTVQTIPVPMRDINKKYLQRDVHEDAYDRAMSLI